MLKGREVGQVGPQRFGAIGNDSIATEVKVLEGRELGQVGPQRLGTFVTDLIIAEALHVIWLSKSLTSSGGLELNRS